MFDLLNKVLSVGLETQDKVIDFLDELVRKGRIDEKEREQFLKELDEKLISARDKGEALINDALSKISSKNPLVTKGDLEKLEKRIKKLEDKLKKLEPKKSTSKKSSKKSGATRKTAASAEENTPSTEDAPRA